MSIQNPTGRAACPLCGANSRDWKILEKIPLLDCEQCGHRFAHFKASDSHIQKQYGDQYFAGGGAGYANYRSEKNVIQEHGSFYGRILSKHRRVGDVLDVGAACGFFLQGLELAGWSGWGVEPNSHMAQIARDEFNQNVSDGAVESFEPDRQFDAVTIVQVLPHLVDPQQVIEKVKNWIRPDGLLLIETWDNESFTAKLFGAHWHEYSPPSVLHWFSRNRLRNWMTDQSFVLVESGRPKKRLVSGHAKSLLRYKFGDHGIGGLASKCLCVIPENIRLPYPGNDVFWMLFRWPG